MVDYTTKPYAHWLEDVLPDLVELDPVSIGLVAIFPNGTTGTAYYNADNSDRSDMIRAIVEDSVLEFIKVNADRIADIIAGDEEEEGGEDE